MSYDLTIKTDDDASGTARVSLIESFLTTVSGIKSVAQNRWVYESDPCGYFEISFLQSNNDVTALIESIGVSIPYESLFTSSEPALKLSFALAEHLEWRVYDEQLEEYISPSDIEDLVATQAEFGELAQEPRVGQWLDRLGSNAIQQSIAFLIIAVTLAGLGALAIVMTLEIPDKNVFSYLFLIACLIGLGLFSIKIAFDALVKGHKQPKR